jgi:hemerythrin
MTLITWSERLSVNVSQCDAQHKILIGLINDLHGAMKEGKANNVLGDIFRAMVDYTKTHFSDEEQLLQAHGYLDLSGQKRSHEMFVQQLDKLYADFVAGSVVTLVVMNFLRDWLENHITVDDKKYGPFLNAKGIC